MNRTKTIALLIGMAFTGTFGLLLLFLACGLPIFSSWWPLFVVIFYILAPIPLTLVRLLVNREWMEESHNVIAEIAYFVSACIVVGGFGLPIVLARQAIINMFAAIVVCVADIFMFATIFSYFVFVRKDDDDWELSQF